MGAELWSVMAGVQVVLAEMAKATGKNQRCFALW